MREAKLFHIAGRRRPMPRDSGPVSERVVPLTELRPAGSALRLLTARDAGRILDSMTKNHTGSSNRAAKGARIVKPRDSSRHNS